jgi:hypothetical protein
VLSGVESEQAKLRAGAEKEKADQALQLRTKWQDHEDSVEKDIRLLCKKHVIMYADSVPFKGLPDNAVEFGGQYHIFDAKSPGYAEYARFMCMYVCMCVCVYVCMCVCVYVCLRV